MPAAKQITLSAEQRGEVVRFYNCRFFDLAFRRRTAWRGRRPPAVDETLFSKTDISKEDFDKSAPEIRDNITVTFEALGGA